MNARLVSPGVLVAVAVLAGCAPSPQEAAPSSPSASVAPGPAVTTGPGPEVSVTAPGASPGVSLSEPASPVTIAAKLDGCVVADGTVEGQYDERGFRTAECSWYGENGNPYAFASITTWPKELTAMDAAPDLLGPRLNPDMETVIIGPGFAVEVADTTLTTLDVEKVAEQAGGKVIK